MRNYEVYVGFVVNAESNQDAVVCVIAELSFALGVHHAKANSPMVEMITNTVTCNEFEEPSHAEEESRPST